MHPTDTKNRFIKLRAGLVAIHNFRNGSGRNGGWARRRAKPISLVDLGKPDNAAQAYSGPVMARRAGHCVVAYSLPIRDGSARRSRRAQPSPARPPFLESIFGIQSKGWSLARIAAHLDVAKRTLVDWNQHSQTEIRTLKAVELEALQEKLLASHEAELTQLNDHLQRIETELAKRSLVIVSTENLYRLAAQLRRQLQQTRLTPALPGEIEPPVAPALNPS